MRFFYYFVFFILIFLISCSKNKILVKIDENITLKLSNNYKLDTIVGIDGNVLKLSDREYGDFTIEYGFNISNLKLKDVILVPLNYGAEEMNYLSEDKYYVEVDRRNNMNIIDPDYYQETNFEIDNTIFNSPVKWVFPINQEKGFNGVFFYKIYQSETMGNYKLKFHTDNNNLTKEEFKKFIMKTLVIGNGAMY